MKIQVSYQGVTVSVEGDDVTLDMLSSLYDQLKEKLDTVRFDTRIDGKDLLLCMNRDGYGEYISGLKQENPEVIQPLPALQKAIKEHQTMAEKGVVNSPDKSPFQPNTMHLVDAVNQVRSAAGNRSLIMGGYVSKSGGIL